MFVLLESRKVVRSRMTRISRRRRRKTSLPNLRREARDVFRLRSPDLSTLFKIHAMDGHVNQTMGGAKSPEVSCRLRLSFSSPLRPNH